MSTQSSWQVTLAAAGLSAAIPIDLRRWNSRGGAGIIVTLNGTGLWGVDVSGDQQEIVQGRAPGFTNWNKHDFLTSLSASANGNLAYPVTAIRLNVTSLTGTITMSLVMAQS
jgi:hypothetical protein